MATIFKVHNLTIRTVEDDERRLCRPGAVLVVQIEGDEYVYVQDLTSTEVTRLVREALSPWN